MQVGLCVRHKDLGHRVRVHGYIIVDNHADGLNVDAASEDVGRDEHFGMAHAEGVDDGVTDTAVQAAGERDDFVAFGGHALFEFGSGFTGLRKDLLGIWGNVCDGLDSTNLDKNDG